MYRGDNKKELIERLKLPANKKTSLDYPLSVIESNSYLFSIKTNSFTGNSEEEIKKNTRDWMMITFLAVVLAVLLTYLVLDQM